MKKVIFIISILIIAIVSCKNDENNNLTYNDSNLSDEVASLENINLDFQSTFEQLKINPNNIKVLDTLDQKLFVLKSKYSVHEVENSLNKPFYSKVDTINQEDVSNFSENPEAFLSYIESSGSELYITYMNAFVNDSIVLFDKDEVIYNTSLMYNEKISLLLLLSYNEVFSAETEMKKVTTINNCAIQYRTDISRCNRNTGVGLAFTGLAAVGSGGLAAAIALSYVWAQDMMCRSDASENCGNCIK